MSIIPFAKDVNVGKANKDATWLKWDTDWEATRYYCSKSNYTSKNSCQNNKRAMARRYP